MNSQHYLTLKVPNKNKKHVKVCMIKVKLVQQLAIQCNRSLFARKNQKKHSFFNVEVVNHNVIKFKITFKRTNKNQNQINHLII